jgi:hypothetical protein
MKRLWLLLSLSLACAHGQGETKSAKAPCPAKPSCLTVMKCQYDADRECDICICSDPYIERGSEPSPGQPPFSR